jgi:hypothetical protein
MSRIEDLSESYRRHIELPWSTTIAGSQRVIMLVYDRDVERLLRAQKGLFRQATEAAGHKWREVDVTNIFAKHMAANEYRDSYFESPEYLDPHAVHADLAQAAAERIRAALTTEDVTDQTVVAVVGVGALFGFTSVSDVIEKVQGHIRGRLLVFFPGEFADSNYRLLGARDGWNYMAVPITMRGQELWT